MEVSFAEAKNQLTKLIRAVEEGESVVITRRKVRLGSMRDGIRLNPGWDEPVDVGHFLDAGL